MDFSAKVLGTTTVRYLRERSTSAVLTIGADTFTRGDLSRVACFHFAAASNLSALLRQLDAKNTRDVFDRLPPESLALPRLGAVSLAVLGAAFEAKKIGGDNPLENWMKKHRPDAPTVTFLSLKHRDERERATEQQDTRDRKRARRNTAHTIRKGRFHQRRGRSTSAATQRSTTT